MWGIFLLSLLASATSSPNIFPLPRSILLRNASNNDYLLPTTITPTKYQIVLAVPKEALTGGITTYDGTVGITFNVNNATNVIKLHSLVNISTISLSDASIGVQNHTHNPTTEIVSIFLNGTLNVSAVYTLDITFQGNLDTVNMNGFYRSEYNINGTKEYLGTTQFQTTHARRAFPCFDEPHLKATFQLTLKHPSDFNARSNTVSNTTTTGNTTETVFVETPVMSTYLVAFVVSKFNCTTSSNLGTNFGVCSRTDLANERDEALQYGMKILEQFDIFTASPFKLTNLSKLDQFAIPDFSAGAMENWGLVTYREYSLIWNKEHTSKIMRQSMLAVIAHEFAHMWFGDLVTTKWWSTTFLNEGFARYFQYFILTQIANLSDFQMEKQFIVDQQQTAFLEDASPKSGSLTSEAWSPAEVSTKFNAISYNKGACIFRMIENLVGSSVYQAALQKYLAANAYGSATPEKLWAHFTDVNKSILPENITFAEFVDNWTNRAGFPLVSVTANGRNVTVSQKRFLNTGDSGNISTEWYVPFTYKLQSGNSYETKWLTPNRSVHLLNNLTDTDLLIANFDSRGYYRVKYCPTLTRRIKSQLKENHTQISELNRAQIIDDVLNLARAGYGKYPDAFELLTYLKNETSYFPWYTTIKNMDYLVARLGADTELGKRTNSFVLDLMTKISANISSTNWDQSDQITTLKLQRIWTAACKRGQSSCLSETKRLFKAFRENNTSLNPNIRDIVYCYALKHSDNITRDWNFLWDRLQSSVHPQDDLHILMSLGCTSHNDFITRLLNQTVESSSVIRRQNLVTVWSSVYSSSKEGVNFAFNYFVNNHAKIIEYYSDGAALLNLIANGFTTNDQITKLQQFANGLPSNSTLRYIADSALETARQNLQFRSGIEKDLNDYFGITTGSSGTTFGISIPLLLFVTALFI